MAKEIKQKEKIISLSLDKSNKNCFIIHFEGGSTKHIAIPPGRNRIDILSDTDIKSGYEYKYEGIIIISTETEKLIFFNGQQIK